MNYDYTSSSADQMSGGEMAASIIVAIIIIAGQWKVYEKANKPGWAAIIPIYNFYVLLKIVNKPGWWVLLYFIPIVNFIVALIVTHKLAIAFGKGIGWTLLLFFLPFIGYPMLGFGNAKFTPLHEVNPANTPDTEDDIKA